MRNVVAVAGGIMLVLGAFQFGRSTHPEEGCCDQLLNRNVELLLARTGGVPGGGTVARAYRPLPSPVDPWPTHPWDGGGMPPGIRGVEG